MSNANVSNTGLRILRAIKALSGHALDGLSNAELAQALNIPPSAVTRLMATMAAEGFATKLDNGRFAPGMALLQVAQRTSNELAAANERINELTQRIHAGARH
ncbi:helix-turn-helix domain-containing protein [Gallaecimonas kandeliae]|uniref:helix-turn-helix domain-containing protein n=1 Tax=Gallaecimonas kandeliae TaxID=3029055 RepID=UPI002648A10A|nr:helix-turn-helix domain-containing protein [Gallaecimonas kandeliae]WKE65050.1 helix-turn-helix domain-containing protein [Gallaecimonas kandeliae]